MNFKSPFTYIITLFALFVLGVNSLFTVRETDQAMVLALGKVDRLIEEPGLKFKIPFYQQVEFFDKRVLETDSTPEEVQTLDKKRIVVDSFTRWKITDAQKFYQAVRTERSAITRMNLIVNSNIRRVVARETLEELVSGDRQRLMTDIKQEASKQAAPFGIEVVDVRIKRADLPGENASAIFRRMQAERQKEAKEIRANGAEDAQKIRADAEKQRTILLAEAERDAQKLRGAGDAEAIKITGRAFNRDADFYNFTRSLEAYEASLANDSTLMIVDDSLPFLKELAR